ncbi:MAG: PHP domain-containing protein [Gemmatimonadaceae bacterium]|nr:PHP domain-containing protein [Gemmatimonadaceae bacterium]
MTGYAELHCHSTFSLLDGASDPERLVERALTLGMPALALTDHDDVGGAVRFATATREGGLAGIHGAELTVDVPLPRGLERHDAPIPGRVLTNEGSPKLRTHIVLLCESREGWGNLCTLITRARLDHPRGEPRVTLEQLAAHTSGLYALSGCPRGWVPQLLALSTGGVMSDGTRVGAACSEADASRLAHEAAGQLSEMFGKRLAIECWDHALPEERALVTRLLPMARALDLPWVVTNDVHYALPTGRIGHDVLSALRHGATLDEMGTRLRPNGEWYLKGHAQLAKRWQGLEQGLAESLRIAERCAFRLEALKPKLPRFPLPPGVSEDEYLARLVEDGAQERWGWRRTARHDKQLEHELTLIARLGLSGYFLIVWDIVRFARREGILCQGRGSAANSAVCYCLGITAVDPIKLELLFERFLSEERAEAPDIDIDFAHRERERVLQYVYQRYGREHAAMVCEHITWRGRSAVRDAARVLGFSAEQAGLLASFSDRFSARNTAAALRTEDGGRRTEDGAAASGAVADPFAPERADAMGPANYNKRALRDAPQQLEAKAQKAGAKEIAALANQRETGPRETNPRDVATRRNQRPVRPATLVDAVSSDLVVGTHASNLIKASREEHRKLRAVRTGAPESVRREGSGGEATRAPEAKRPQDRTAVRELRAGSPRGRPDPTPKPEPTLLERAGLDSSDPRVQKLADIVEQLDAAPRHRGIHVGGFVLTEEPLRTVVPIEPASMEDRTVIQWEKDDLDPVGLVKIDLLGLGMLTVVQDCLAYIRRTRGVTLDLGQLDCADQAVYDDLCKADTVGVFQVESRAQMNTLPRLKPRCFYDLVVEVALIRPGPIQGEMVHPYLRRKAGVEEVTYPHPSLEPILKRTLGVPLFQEQGMQVAIAAAGFTAGEADLLRKAMGHKRSRERMADICQRMIDGMRANGIPEDIALRIYNQINAFADYGFPESHAASFALIVYASAYLRHYYAPEFLCAMLNAQPMGFYAPGTLIEDARRHGVRVRPVDITRSGWDHTLEPGEGRNAAPVVRLGIRSVLGLGSQAKAKIEAARKTEDEGRRTEAPAVPPSSFVLRPPSFSSIADFVTRTNLDRRSLRALAESGAFDAFVQDEPPNRRRRVALWRVLEAEREAPGPLALFPESPVPQVLPGFSAPELTEADYRLTGLSLNGHPMRHVRALLIPNGVRTAREIHTMQDGDPIAHAGLVICRQRPGTAKGFVFLTLEDETGTINVVVTPQRFEEQAMLISRTPLLLVRGTLQVESGVYNIRAQSFAALKAGAGEDAVRGHNYR